MRIIIAVLYLLVSLAYVISIDKEFERSLKQIVDQVNDDPDSTWVAEIPDRFENLQHAKQLLTMQIESEHLKQQRRPTIKHKPFTKLPERFDARKKWHNCKSIGQVRDQSACGSCWAFAAVEAMSDRICIHSKGTTQPELSAIDLTSCCNKCGLGCKGGYLGPAWDYWKSTGIVTGGSLENSTGCRPYPFPKCSHLRDNSTSGCGKLQPTPLCTRMCQDKYSKSYTEDIYYGKSSYNIEPNELDIMKEVYENGPIEVGFMVYRDFLSYKKGIYCHKEGESLGGHAVKLIGWGVKKGVKYWLLVNSWNEEWGEKGLFRFKRGTNECDIEGNAVAGLPRI